MKKLFLFLVVVLLCSGCGNGSSNTGGGGHQHSDDPTNPKIGDTGAGGGIIFRIENDEIWEISEKLGSGNWEEAKALCKKHRGGNYDNWCLPSKEELDLVYEALVKTEKIVDDDIYWSSSELNDTYAWQKYFKGGHVQFNSKTNTNSVRAVRVYKS